MPNKNSCGRTSSSFFLIDKNYQLTFFKIDSPNDLGSLLAKNPVIGESVVEIIAQNYRKHFTILLSRCFEGHCFSIEQRLSVFKSNDLIFHIIFTPLTINEITDTIVCTVADISSSRGVINMIREYSHLTSHQLRAPITNILSLSTITNYAQLASYDALKMSRLLNDINLQAVKLDEIIKMLNKMLNKHDCIDLFDKPGPKSDHNHIVLVDDDVVTNKLHKMLIRKHHSDKRIVLFDNPQKALSYIQQHTPDLILLDLHMPGIDGWRFLEMMEELNVFIDVVIVSSSIDPRERSKAKSFLCVKDFYTKPLTIEKVSQLLDH
ncbi:MULTISPECIES: response regulator [Pedobacter]|uniref:Response regulator receiver n=1 Tax=Pedobacter heparinus (strain ATCC 13125 / DSM 2366 / CIP 104194 / JCM 7457 / NBRC 12017 / NCIMB 9290 / NRRL B-14731 / HIM 762-3) TaxID=485917 RepID=C6XUJ0_PEDHD|nr:MULTISPECIES: response regulator [Pedobacter]ACU03840.1 response regulator receiver [Pedobacter heparinus DSM 2366]MBB5436638.1 CheY-like chemotaxis protein [Pedobacter sp. AK017]